MKLSVDDQHPFKLGDVLLDATGEASFVEEAVRSGLYRRTQTMKNQGFNTLEYPVLILAREGEPTDLFVEKVQESVVRVVVDTVDLFEVSSV